MPARTPQTIDKGQPAGNDAREADETVAALLAIVARVKAGKLWGRFGVAFQAQDGVPVLIEEIFNQTRKI